MGATSDWESVYIFKDVLTGAVQPRSSQWFSELARDSMHPGSGPANYSRTRDHPRMGPPRTACAHQRADGIQPCAPRLPFSGDTAANVVQSLSMTQKMKDFRWATEVASRKSLRVIGAQSNHISAPCVRWAADHLHYFGQSSGKAGPQGTLM